MAHDLTESWFGSCAIVLHRAAKISLGLALAGLR